MEKLYLYPPCLLKGMHEILAWLKYFTWAHRQVDLGYSYAMILLVNLWEVPARWREYLRRFVFEEARDLQKE